MRRRPLLTVLSSIIACGVVAHAQTRSRIPRTADGHPDLQGVWNNGTVTPLQRPTEFKDKAVLTDAEAAEYERTALARLLESIPEEDRTGADLNEIYIDAARVVGDRRTSLVVDPPDGHIPPLLPEALKRRDARRPSNLDDPEGQGLDERCLLSVPIGTSNASPPIVPNPFASNFYQIVQTPTYVLILSELVHDARIIRIGGEHAPASVRFWLGDSIGRWEGDTLVVDTTNFTGKTHFRNSGERLHVVERFTRADAGTIAYRFTVDDPETWARPWSAEIPFLATDKRVFEYACHEGNYSMVNALRGARAQEREAPAPARPK